MMKIQGIAKVRMSYPLVTINIQITTTNNKKDIGQFCKNTFNSFLMSSGNIFKILTLKNVVRLKKYFGYK